MSDIPIICIMVMVDYIIRAHYTDTLWTISTLFSMWNNLMYLHLFSSLHLFVYNETILSSASSFSSASMFLSFLFFAVQSSLLLDENESVHLNSGKHVEGLLSSIPKTKSEPHSVIMIQLVRFEHTHIHHAIHSGTSIYLNRKSTATTRKDCSIERGYYE